MKRRQVTDRYAMWKETLYDNGKVCSFSHRAFRLWACSLSYARKHRTDGHLAPEQVAVLLRLYGLSRRDVDELVQKRGWEAEGDGYRIHDFLEHNKSEQEMTAVSEARAEAGAAGGRRSGESRREAIAEAFASTDNEANANKTKSKSKTEIDGSPTDYRAAPPAARALVPVPKNGVVPKPHQEMVAALGDAFGEPGTRSGWGMYAAAAKELVVAGADAGDVAYLAQRWDELYPGATCTPTALAKHYGALTTQRRAPNGHGRDQFAGIKQMLADDARNGLRRVE